jgi:type IV pilus assembly protein PilB
MALRLGELLVRENMITSDQLRKAIEEQKRTGGRLGTHLTGMGYIGDEELTQFLSKQYGVPAINLAEFDIDAEVIKLIPRDVAEKHQVIPINRAGATLIVAMSDPSNIFAIDDIKFLTGYNVEAVVASEDSIKRAIDQRYAEAKAAAEAEAALLEQESVEENYEELLQDFNEDVEVVEDGDEMSANDLARAGEDAPVIKLVNLILMDAIKKKASDIHIEPYEKSFRVRYRIDGELYEVMKPPKKLQNAITSRIKIMSQLDIAERRLPQDGRIKLKMGKGKEMDFRVSVLPTLFGEKTCMRLLDKSNLQLDMTKLGFDQEQLNDFQYSIDKPYGMCLVTGPTGSGKTTTLYSALAYLNDPTTNLSTAEDPVEFNLGGINQVNVKEDIGLSFAAALRSFLRQDPDIIMVGEIRDFETAEIAVKAALTGHMVLSTLHTNDAPGTINRLLNMGIEPFLVASAVNCIVAQRLARRICGECKEPIELPKQALLDIEAEEDDIPNYTLYKGKGCATCNNTGYKGRVAIYEVLVMKDEIKEMVLNGASTVEIKREAIRLGFQSLRLSALKKLKAGVTTVEEVIKNSVADKQ